VKVDVEVLEVEVGVRAIICRGRGGLRQRTSYRQSFGFATNQEPPAGTSLGKDDALVPRESGAAILSGVGAACLPRSSLFQEQSHLVDLYLESLLGNLLYM